MALLAWSLFGLAVALAILFHQRWKDEEAYAASRHNAWVAAIDRHAADRTAWLEERHRLRAEVGRRTDALEKMAKECRRLQQDQDYLAEQAQAEERRLKVSLEDTRREREALRESRDHWRDLVNQICEMAAGKRADGEAHGGN